MPTKSNRPSREEVRTSILKTARDIAAADGWAAVTVRKVAQRIGYTAPIIYEHFGSKDEMLNQILKDGYDALFVSMKQLSDQQSSSEGRLRAFITAYWDFSHDTPELYQLMYGMEGARATSEEARDYASPITAYVTQELVRFNPLITPAHVAIYMVKAWSMLHGTIALDISGYTQRYVSSDTLKETVTNDILQLMARHPD